MNKSVVGLFVFLRHRRLKMLLKCIFISIVSFFILISLLVTLNMCITSYAQSYNLFLLQLLCLSSACILLPRTF